MRELTQIRDAVIAALQGGGLAAEAAFPARRAERHPEALASVSVETAEGKSMGFCNYLGEARDEDGGMREWYGKLLEGVIAVEVRAEAAAVCEDGAERAAAVLLSGLPEGLRPGELRWEALAWERETGMFLRRGNLSCKAWFTARAEEDGPVFLDFILKGVRKE